MLKGCPGGCQLNSWGGGRATWWRKYYVSDGLWLVKNWLEKQYFFALELSLLLHVIWLSPPGWSLRKLSD